jgi:hypothetical protein
LYGYFQSSKYFSDISGLVRTWFEPHQSLQTTVAEKYADVLSSSQQTVVVHVRRGDYLVGGNKGYHGFLTERYYNAAMAEARRRLGADVRFLLFSDDVNYCRKTWGALPTVQIVDEPDGCLALHLMSRFKHFIMSNSTFSWWAVYLSQPASAASASAAATVIVPDKWFGPKGPQDYQDIYEPEWIQLKAE